MSFETVDLICHSDWSINPLKRWISVASLQSNHRWQVPPLARVVDPSTFFVNLKAQAKSSACILAGFDFPIGLPAEYAYTAGISDFLATIPLFGHNEWDEFYNPAETPDQISLHRPFYPLRPGNSKRTHLEQGLGLPFASLYRLCEIAHKNRRAACPLFWTLGGQQVGKAAIHGWRELLSPALAQAELSLKLWPFSGSLTELCLPGNIVVIETYPTEYYGHLGIFIAGERRSKRSLSGRKFYADKLISWSGRLQIDLDDTLLDSIREGFGDHPESEDQFDAMIGLYGMINVVSGNHPAGEPFSPMISEIEGWIFGQEQPASEI